MLVSLMQRWTAFLGAMYYFHQNEMHLHELRKWFMRGYNNGIRVKVTAWMINFCLEVPWHRTLHHPTTLHAIRFLARTLRNGSSIQHGIRQPMNSDEVW